MTKLQHAFKSPVNKSRCQPCVDSYRRWYDAQSADPELTERRRRRTRQAYLRQVGITPEQYERQLALQGDRCANPHCNAVEPGRGKTNWCIDHDHSCCPGPRTCGKCFRGLLCADCNNMLGHGKDSPTSFRWAADYVEAFRCSSV